MYFQVKLRGGGILHFGKKPLVKNTPLIPVNVSWGVFFTISRQWTTLPIDCHIDEVHVPLYRQSLQSTLYVLSVEWSMDLVCKMASEPGLACIEFFIDLVCRVAHRPGP